MKENRWIQSLPSQAAIERDHERLFESVRLRRLHNPSMRDRALSELISAMGLKCLREFRLGSSLYSIGFYLEEVRLGLEIAPAEAERSRGYKRSDAIKRKQVLCAHLGIRLITVDSAELDENPNLVAEAIEAVIDWSAAAAA